MSSKRYTSVEQIRKDKLRVKSKIDDDVHHLRTSLADCFMPSSNKWLRSSSKYMNYIGYGIVAYKTYTTFRGAFKFLRKLI